MTPWPCSCGAPGVRNVGTHGYCSACLGALFATFDPVVFADNGVGLLSGAMRDEYGPGVGDLTCNHCDARWVGTPGERCAWCRSRRPVTILVRRELLIEVDGFPIPGTPEWPHEDCEDWACWRRIRDAGGVFVHTPEVSWLWHHHGQNTSGRGDRWPGKPVFA